MTDPEALFAVRSAMEAELGKIRIAQAEEFSARQRLERLEQKERDLRQPQPATTVTVD